MADEKSYGWETVKGRIFVDGIERAAVIDHDRRITSVASELTPEATCAAVKVVLDRLEGFPIQPPTIIYNGPRRDLPEGYQWVSGCYASRVIA